MEQPEASGNQQRLNDRTAQGKRGPAVAAMVRTHRQPEQARPGARRAGRPTGAAVRTLQPAAAGQAVRQSVDRRPEDEPQQSDQDVHRGVLYRPVGSPLALVARARVFTTPIPSPGRSPRTVPGRRGRRESVEKRRWMEKNPTPGLSQHPHAWIVDLNVVDALRPSSQVLPHRLGRRQREEGLPLPTIRQDRMPPPLVVAGGDERTV